MHPLDGLRLKIARAITEIDRFSLREKTFFENNHYNVVRAEKNLESGNDIYRIKIDGVPPSLDWGIYIGEIAHNLRSALNYLVYQLAFLNGANKSETITGDKRLQFPIYLQPSEFIAKGKNMIKLLRPVDRESIERLQPYNSSGNTLLKTVDLAKWSGCKSPLFWLEDINNADKHRIIQVIGVRPGGFNTTHWGGQPDAFIGGTFGIVEGGTIFGEAIPDVPMNVEIVPVIAFANGCDAIVRQPVCPLLGMVATTVSEIVESFASEFD